MRLEKLALKSLDGSTALHSGPKRPYVPPSLLPEPPKPETPAAPPPPVFSEADLKKAEQEGYRKGFLEGTKEGQMQAKSEQADIDKQLTEAVAQMAAKLGGLIAEYNALSAAQRQEMPHMALAMAKKVAGQALVNDPMPAIETTVIAYLERTLGAPHITVTVNDKLMGAMEHRLVSHFASSSEPGEISILGDASLQPGDCRIDWGSGKAERDTAALWQQIESLLGDKPAAPEEPPQTPPPATEQPPTP